MTIEAHKKLSTRLPELAAALQDVLEEFTGERVLFALHIFGDGTEGRGQYVSNAKTSNVREALKELLARWEAEGLPEEAEPVDDGPFHKYQQH